MTEHRLHVDGEDFLAHRPTLAQPTAWLFGNEARGLDDDALRLVEAVAGLGQRLSAARATASAAPGEGEARHPDHGHRRTASHALKPCR